MDLTKAKEIAEWYAHMGIDAVIGRTIDDANAKRDINISRSDNMHDIDKVKRLESLKERILAFDACSLKHIATNIVFADGNYNAKIMLIGEAPGATEDALGIPFSGESGKLLDNMMRSIGLSRDKNLYITNTVFWRPPANRRPTQEEIDQCKPFVEEHIAIINPELLILVGSTAVESLLGKHLQISRIRQEYYSYNNNFLDRAISTTALFHPAYLLRQPMQKKSTWYDLLKIKSFISGNTIYRN